MRGNLDSLKQEIQDYLERNNFIVFHGFSRRAAEMPEVEWDVFRYPDFRQYLKVAKQLDASAVIFHHREFSAAAIDSTFDDLDSGFALDDDGTLRRRLNELRVYEGFTCVVELSFQHSGTLYFFEVHTDWYDEFEDIRRQLDFGDEPEDGEDEDDETLGGYYSKN